MVVLLVADDDKAEKSGVDADGAGGEASAKVSDGYGNTAVVSDVFVDENGLVEKEN